jgi:hypothetical protein
MDLNEDSDTDSDNEDADSDSDSEEDESSGIRFFLRRKFRVAMLLACRLRDRIATINTPRLGTPDPIPHIRITFDSFTDQEYDNMLGFGRLDCEQMYDKFSFPEDIICGNDAHKFKVNGVHCFLYMLFRFKSPSERQTLDSRLWGYDYTVLSKMFNESVIVMDHNYGHLLNTLPNVGPRFAEFNLKILHHLLGRINEEIPPHAARCALFADCCRYRTSKPGVCIY